MRFPQRTLTAIGLACSVMMIVSVFMVWVNYEDAVLSIVSGTITGWEALTDENWSYLEDYVTDYDYHLLPMGLLAIGAASAMLFVGGFMLERMKYRMIPYCLTGLMGIALIYGIHRFLLRMKVYYGLVEVWPGNGTWLALIASAAVVALSAIAILHLMMIWKNSRSSEVQGSA